MTIRPSARTSDADWLMLSGDGWQQLVTFGPSGFALRLVAGMAGVPERLYFMAEGTSDDVQCWDELFDGGGPVPAFVWPADRAWCFASDVDPHWAGIGASTAAIDALLRSPLDVVSADPAATQPTYT